VGKACHDGEDASKSEKRSYAAYVVPVLVFNATGEWYLRWLEVRVEKMDMEVSIEEEKFEMRTRQGMMCNRDGKCRLRLQKCIHFMGDAEQSV